MVSLTSSGNLPSDAVQYRYAARVHAASGSFLIQQYTALQVCQPAGERDISVDTAPRPAAVTPGHCSERYFQ